ncbi:MAG: hypothetical protein NTX03_00950 [Bacteroidetes bacterium]|nr:hypothetical protein [Bacteroidota bacterium]
MNNFLNKLIANYKWLMAVAILIGGVAVYFMLKIQVDNSIRIWFVEDSPEIKKFEAFQKKYGNDELVSVLITSEKSVFERENLKTLMACEKELKTLPFVENAYSIASVQ